MQITECTLLCMTVYSNKNVWHKLIILKHYNLTANLNIIKLCIYLSYNFMGVSKNDLILINSPKFI